MSAEFGSRLQALVEGPALEGRKAALLLHSLAEQDRKWMLDRLDPRQKTEIEPLLAELRSLEVPVQPDLVRTLVRDAAAGTAPSQRLAGVSPGAVHDLLSAEPARFVAQALQLGPASWSADPRARVLRRGAGESPDGLPAALASALQEELAQRLHALQTQAAARQPSPGTHAFHRTETWWVRLWRKMRRPA